MNRVTKISGLIAVSLIMILTIQSAAGESASSLKKSNKQDYFTTFRGKVIDAETGAALVFATVTIQGTNIATVTNIDGEFIIKVPVENKEKGIEFTYIGYNNKVVRFDELKEDGFRNIISLQLARITLQEIIVKPVTPEEIIQNAIEAFPKNYPTDPNLMTAFYRETIKKSRNYVAIGEAVVEVFKAPYNNDLRIDGIRMYKGRKGSDITKMDTVLFKLQGGPVTSLQLDLVKNPEAILTKESMVYYDYALTSIIMIDENPHYVIEFRQREEIKTPLFFGKIYIDTRSYAIKEIEFGLDLSNKEQASALFIRKKPLSMEVTPEVATYRVSYRENDGKYYFAYSRAEVKFKVEWKKKLFSTNYTTMSEIAITDRTTEEVIKFAGRERIKFSDVFSDKVSDFTDPEFWGDYNVIEPDQSIESAIRRLSRRLRFSDIEGK
jgi:hypothetical protein